MGGWERNKDRLAYPSFSSTILIDTQQFDNEPSSNPGGRLSYRNEGYLRLGKGAGGVDVQQQGDHADEAGDGEDAHTSKGLLADRDLALRVVVAGCQDGGDAYPGG